MPENFDILVWGMTGALVAYAFEFLEVSRWGVDLKTWVERNKGKGPLIAFAIRLAAGALAAWLYVTQVPDTLVAITTGFAGVVVLAKIMDGTR